jgi:adenylate cyclase
VNKPQLTEVPRAADGQPAPTPRRGLMGIPAELRKRRVCRTAISYMLIMWLNLQIGDVLFPILGLPEWALTLIIIVGVMGFPVMLILAWVFQVTPAGIVVDQAHKDESTTEHQLDTAINCLLLLCSVILSVLLLLQFATDGRGSLIELPAENQPTGYVLTQLNIAAASADERSRTFAAGVQEELRYELINLGDVDVLPDSAQLAPDDGRRRLALTGSLMVEGSTAHVLANLIDLSAGRYVMSVAFNLAVDSTLELRSAAAGRIVRAIQTGLVPGDGVLASTPQQATVNPRIDDPV